MELERISELLDQLAKVNGRSNLANRCGTGLLELFHADAAIVWLTDLDKKPGVEDIIVVHGPLAPPSAMREIARAAASDRLERWLGGRGASLFGCAQVECPKMWGQIAVAWRHTRLLPAEVDATLHIIAGQFSLLLDRELSAVPRSLNAIHAHAQPAAEANDPYRSVFDSTADYVFAKDVQGRYMEANAAYLAALALPAAKVIGKTDAELFPPDVANDAVARDQIVELSGETLESEATLTLGGKPRVLLMRRSPWRSVKGDLIGVITVATDITERKSADLERERLMRQLQETNSRIEQALAEKTRLSEELQKSLSSLRSTQGQMVRAQKLRALGEMASGVAHDFNNSLTTILGLLEWLLHTAPADLAIRSDLETIRTAAVDAAAIVRRLQLFGRSAPDAEAEPVDLGEIAQLVVNLARPRWRELAQRRGVQFDLVVESDPEPAPAVRAVSSEIRELLMNLVFNAIDAMPKGGRITIRTGRSGDKAFISVADQGTGISDEVKSRIFEPFFTTKGKDGAGLGLSVCWGIAERAGGMLEVDSTPGEGATFTLMLPALAGAAAPARPAADPAPSPAAPKASRRLAVRVLLVDDQADVLESVADMLAALGHHVVAAESGEIALRQFKRETFDVVMTDLGMPGINGLELARRLRSERPGLPVLLLTGWGADYEDHPPEEVSMVLSKPVTMKSLQEALLRTLVEAPV
ncbi:MAG: PAS domain-containing protein [Acidobacteriota bacterium]|nr:PAS domain-containing protein [Acidobacteriota bacterium]